MLGAAPMTMQIPGALIDSLRAARHVMVLSGAGISAESGLATFRIPQTGLWERFRPEELAMPQAFRRDPALVWGWYEWRRMQVMRASPNPAHRAVADLQSLVPELTLVTQNVDDLHERAGSEWVVHLHGQIGQPHCETCRQPHALGPEIPDEPENGHSLDPPSCLHCKGSVVCPPVAGLRASPGDYVRGHRARVFQPALSVDSNDGRQEFSWTRRVSRWGSRGRLGCQFGQKLSPFPASISLSSQYAPASDLRGGPSHRLRHTIRPDPLPYVNLVLKGYLGSAATACAGKRRGED